MRALGGKYDIVLSRLKIPNWCKTRPTYKLGPNFLSVLFISKIDMLGHNMRAYGGEYGITLSRHKILNESKTGSTRKLGPDSATGVGDHRKKHRVPLRHFQPVLSYKGLKLDSQHTVIVPFLSA